MNDILIVDDNESLRDAFELMLSEHGFRVITARSGRKAIESLAEAGNPPRIAIVDLRMPDLDGPATIEALRDQHPGLRVIAVSGQMLSPYFGRLAELGVRHFLPKPFLLEELLESMLDVGRAA